MTTVTQAHNTGDRGIPDAIMTKTGLRILLRLLQSDGYTWQH